jgi:hypothetical protein
MFLRVLRGYLKAEIESEIIAAQVQALETNHCATKILKTETANADCVNSTMRQQTALHQCAQCWQQYDETADCITSACPVLATEQYVKRHDTVRAQLHFNIRKELGVTLDEHWCERVLKLVDRSCESKLTILLNQQVKTNRTNDTSLSVITKNEHFS